MELFIRIKTAKTTTCLVNVKMITSVIPKPSGQGCTLYFQGEDCISTEESYESIVDRIESSNQTIFL